MNGQELVAPTITQKSSSPLPKNPSREAHLKNLRAHDELAPASVSLQVSMSMKMRVPKRVPPVVLPPRPPVA
jgi:hypothetical protein